VAGSSSKSLPPLVERNAPVFNTYTVSSATGSAKMCE
jgi:hypothetical protein